MTTRGDVLSMIDFLSAGLADQNECTRCFGEVMIAMAHSPTPWCTDVAVTSTGMIVDTSDIDQYELRTVVVKLLGVFYGGRQLFEEKIACLAASNTNWREQRGEPYAYTREGEEGRILRLFPKPRRVPITGESFSSYTDSPMVVYADAPTTEIPEVLLLPLALLVLAREFERESNHRDMNAAQVWRAMGESLLTRMY